MEKILKDFDKLLATINNDKNNFLHYDVIRKMVDTFDEKYSVDYQKRIHCMVNYLYYKIDEKLKKGLNETQHQAV